MLGGIGVKLFDHIGGVLGTVFKGPIGKACLGGLIEGFLIKPGGVMKLVQALCFGQKAWNGVAILARREGPAADAELTLRGLPGQEDFGSRLITARAGGLSFTTLYCPNGKSLEHADFERKLAWFEALAAHVGPGDGEARVLCGDFNICPAPRDSWRGAEDDGKIFRTEAERERFQRILDCGFVDLFRERHPQEQIFSWWDYRGGSFHRGHGLRIDFLLGSPGVALRLEDVGIDRDWRKKLGDAKPSDHAPVTADLRAP